MRSVKQTARAAAIIMLLCIALMLSSCKDKNNNGNADSGNGAGDVFDVGGADSHIEITKFTAGYLTEAEFIGGYEDGNIDEDVSFPGAENAYMVIDFTYKVQKETDSGKYITLETLFPGRGVLDITIEEAPTSGIEEIESTDGTHLATSFRLQASVGESESVRVILRLMPISGGEVPFRLMLGATEGIDVGGSNVIYKTINTGEARLIYEINPDGKSYSVAKGISIIRKAVIPEKLNDGLPVTAIKDGAFLGCGFLESVILPNGLVSIGADCFKGCTKLTEVSISEGVKSIGASAFEGCTSLIELEIPDGVEEIGASAFARCIYLKEISLGSAIGSIGNDAFYDCGTLDIVNVADIAAWCGISFASPTANPLKYTSKIYLNGEQVTRLVIPEGVIKIGDYAFYNCSAITELVIPAGVSSVGADAFYLCPVKEVTAPPAALSEIPRGYLESLRIHGSGRVTDCRAENLVSVVIEGTVESIGSEAFMSCKRLADVTICEGVKTIENEAFFECSALTGIVIPDSVTSIGREAFGCVYSLSSVVIGSGVEYIGAYAFWRCDSLEKVYYRGTASEWNGISIDSSDSELNSAARYYYSETASDGSCWHYDENGEIVIC
ncbi:MAG: leucine-rich repeat domain-containing protein [Ruminococcaceae bacterium]|nr:leucine-rich repeat domain-containing protein [Oscillospiraceae bacterium]